MRARPPDQYQSKSIMTRPQHSTRMRRQHVTRPGGQGGRTWERPALRGAYVGQGSLRPGSLHSEECKFRRPYKRPPPFLVPNHTYQINPQYHCPQRNVCFSCNIPRAMCPHQTRNAADLLLSIPGDRYPGCLGGFISVHMTETHHMKEGRRKACDAPE